MNIASLVHLRSNCLPILTSNFSIFMQLYSLDFKLNFKTHLSELSWTQIYERSRQSHKNILSTGMPVAIIKSCTVFLAHRSLNFKFCPDFEIKSPLLTFF